MQESYSIQMLKKSAFEHEILNVLNTIPVSKMDMEQYTAMEYLKKRVLELKA